METPATFFKQLEKRKGKTQAKPHPLPCSDVCSEHSLGARDPLASILPRAGASLGQGAGLTQALAGPCTTLTGKHNWAVLLRPTIQNKTTWENAWERPQEWNDYEKTEVRTQLGRGWWLHGRVTCETNKCQSCERGGRVTVLEGLLCLSASWLFGTRYTENDSISSLLRSWYHRRTFFSLPSITFLSIPISLFPPAWTHKY